MLVTHMIVSIDILAKRTLIWIKSELTVLPVALLSAIDRNQGGLYLTFYNFTIYSFLFCCSGASALLLILFLHLAGHKDGEKTTLGKGLKFATII